MTIDIKKATKEDIARGLELLQKENIRKEKIARGEIKGPVKWSEMTPEQKAKAKEADKRRNTRIKLERLAFLKAVQDGILPAVTDAQVEEAIK